MNKIVDLDTGEVLDPSAQKGGTEFDPLLSSAIKRSEKLLERQDKLLDENSQLRLENERLQGLYSEAKAQFHNLIAQAQAEFDTLKRDNSVEFPTKKGGSFRAETASMEAAGKAIGDSLSKRGIALRQPVIDHPGERELSIIRTTLSYNGYEEHHDISIMSAYAHSKTGADVKAFGADVSLVRKYALFAALGLVQETPENKKSSNNNNQRYQGNQSARSSAPAHASHAQAAPIRANPPVAANSSQASEPISQDHPGLRAARTTSELSAAMNAIPREQRAQFTGYFNQRRTQIQNSVQAA